MGKVTTKSILDLVYKISKETGENPLDIIKKACERGSIEIPGNVGFKIKATGNLGKIKIGNELYFKIENWFIYIYVVYYSHLFWRYNLWI